MPQITFPDKVAGSTFTADDANSLKYGVNGALTTIAAIIPGVLSSPLIVNVGAGQSFGGTSTGDTYALGSSLEAILRKVLVKIFAPVLSLSSSISSAIYEVGTVISPIFTDNFTQNDGGAATTIVLQRNGTQLSGIIPFTDTNLLIIDGDFNYQAIANYTAAAALAGIANSNTISYYGRRKIFGGTPSALPTTTAMVRALSLSALNPVTGNTILTIPIALGSTQVAFAYPATLADITSVQYLELSNSEVKSLFTKTLINVEGANGYLPISYKLYTYTPSQAFQANITYKIIL